MRLSELETHCNVAATIHGRQGATVCGRITKLASDKCEIECDQVFRCTESIDIHIRGMGQIRATVVSAGDGVIVAQLVEDCPV